MNTPGQDEPIARRAREVFEAASGAVDPTTAGRLRLARRETLSATPPPRGWLAPLAGAVAVALAAWLAWPRIHAPTPAPAPAPIVTTPVVPTTIPAPDAPAAPPAPALVEAPAEGLLEDNAPVDGDTAWAAFDEEDAELYAWLADAPVAPDDDGDAL